MTKKTPAKLTWSPEYHAYLWQEAAHLPLNVWPEEPAMWSVWLANHSSFSFHGKHGHLSLLKERRPRGGEGYWYAYRSHGQRTVKKYAGRTATLSFAHLEKLAQALRAHMDETPPVQESAQLKPDHTRQTSQTTWEATRLMAPQVDSFPSSSLPESVPLLVSKLHPPRPHASHLLRERLLVLLDRSLEQKLTLLCAPAGYGKTTLVSTWIASRGKRIPPVAWLSLETNDNDPIRFWHAVIAACQTFQDGMGSEALALLHPLQPSPFPRFSQEALLTVWLNELARFPGRGILVLEDYHVITLPEIHQGMRFFLEHLPATLHLLLLTRLDPPLPLATLRARDDLSVIGVPHLRFSLEETRTLLQQTLPFPVEQALLEHFQERTEGWAAGLRLLALALENQGPVSAQETGQRLSLRSSDLRHLLEYLVAEVLLSQPEPLQTFLLQTSGLHRLTGSLCDAVTGRNDSASLLEQMERAHLFLLPVAGSEPWYRYHPLFAEVLSHEAHRRLGEEVVRGSARRASHWYEQHGLLSEAVEAAFAAGDREQAAVLMTRLIEARPLFQLRQYQSLLRWLEQLPEALLWEFPTLSQAYALVVFFSGRQRTPSLTFSLERALERAESKLRATNQLPRLGEAFALHAFIARHLNDTETAIRCAKLALPLLSAQEANWRQLALGVLGLSALLAGRFAEAQQTIQQSWSGGHAAVPGEVESVERRGLLMLRSYLALGQGHLQQAKILLQQMLDLAGKDDWGRRLALVGIATLSFEWNQLATAEQVAREAHTQSQEEGDALLQVLATIILARVLHARGDRSQAEALLHHLSTHLTQPRWLHEIELWLAWFAFTSRDWIAVQRWLATCQTASPNEERPEIVEERAALLTGRLLIAQGKAYEALDALEHWRQAAQQQMRLRSEVEILLLTAQAYSRLQRHEEAKQALLEALALAQPAGYQRLFLDEGEGLIALLRAALPSVREQPLRSFLRSLLQAFAHPSGPSAPGEGPVAGSLSPQEHRILRLLAAGRTNAEVARELVVSLNTVKTQVKSIYRKLHVGSRQEACDLARELHLISFSSDSSFPNR